MEYAGSNGSIGVEKNRRVLVELIQWHGKNHYNCCGFLLNREKKSKPGQINCGHNEGLRYIFVRNVEVIVTRLSLSVPYRVFWSRSEGLSVCVGYYTTAASSRQRSHQNTPARRPGGNIQSYRRIKLPSIFSHRATDPQLVFIFFLLLLLEWSSFK